jgi:hypothetical protein
MSIVISLRQPHFFSDLIARARLVMSQRALASCGCEENVVSAIVALNSIMRAADVLGA